MVLIPMFLLVSFAFESLPLPVLTRLLKAVILDFFFVCRGKCPTFIQKLLFQFPRVWSLYKARVEAQKKERI